MRTGKAKHIDVRLKNGPFDNHVIKMSIGQSETLVFKVNGGEYGHYIKYIRSNFAYWVLEEATK